MAVRHLTDDQRELIRAAVRGGCSQTILARTFGVSTATVAHTLRPRRVALGYRRTTAN
jgi:IS30 family transposase